MVATLADDAVASAVSTAATTVAAAGDAAATGAVATEVVKATTNSGPFDFLAVAFERVLEVCNYDTRSPSQRLTAD